MITRITEFVSFLMIGLLLLTGCNANEQKTPQAEAMDEVASEVALPPVVQVPQGVEKLDPIDISDMQVGSISFPALSTFRNIFGAPHILQEAVCYYMGSWNPGGTLMMIVFHEDTIIACETLTYNEGALYSYLPQLIESIQHEDRDVANKALDFLTTVMRLTYPNGYYEQYTFTKTPYKDTPFEKSMPVWHENAYQDWKTWWDREGHKDFERMANPYSKSHVNDR